MTERDLFIEAMQIESPSERLAFLSHACGADVNLRQQVDALLDSHARAGKFLEEPALVQVGATTDASGFPKLTELADVSTRKDDAESLSLSFLSPPQSADELGRLGSYRLLRLLGQGGMGIVFLAEDTKLERPVAVKVLRPELAADSESRQRFLREGRAAALVRSDHVVTIYHVDEERNLPYLVMEVLRGELLAERLDREGRLPVAECLRIAREIAEGLADAHATGLIHRDIKPANVWLEEPASRAKLLDFGLARARNSPLLTQRHVILGTPAYMAPEQAASRPVDERTDLFSLGAVLYHMLTGRRPFSGDDLMVVLSNLATASTPPASSLVPGLPPAVVELLDRLLCRDPDGRPATAAAVVEALRSLEGCVDNVNERGRIHPAVSENASRRRRRRSWLIAASVLIGLAGLAAAMYGFPFGRDANAEKSGQVPPAGDGSLAPTVTAEANPAGKSASKSAQMTWPDPLPREFTLTGHMPQVEAVAFAADGNTLIAASYYGEVTFWDVAQQKHLFEPMQTTKPAHLRCIAVDSQSRWLAVGQDNPDIRLFQFGQPLCVGLLRGQPRHQVMQMAFLQDGHTLLSTGFDGAVRSWNVESRTEGKPYRLPSKKDERIDCMAFWEDGKGGLRLAVAGQHVVQVDGRQLERVPYQILGLAMSKDGTRLASPAREHGVSIWQVPERNRMGILPDEENPQALAFTPDGKFTIVTGTLRTYIYQSNGGKRVATLGHHEKGISMAVSPDGRWLAVGTMIGTVRVWHLPQVLDERADLGN